MLDELLQNFEEDTLSILHITSGQATDDFILYHVE